MTTCPLAKPLTPALTATVNIIARILSDHRAAHHDLTPHLLPFAPIPAATVPHILIRCRRLPSSAHRFFLFASSTGTDTSPSLPILIQLLASARHFPLIWAHLSDLPHSQLHPAIFHLIFRAYARARLPADALRAFHVMTEFNITPSLSDLHHLLLPLCKNHLASHAHQYFNHLKDLYQLSVTEKTYCIVMNGYAAEGNYKPAVELFDEMVNSGLHVDVVAYNTLLAALCQGGEMEEGYRRLREMRKVYGLEPDAATYAVFIRSACAGKDLNSAMRVMETMRRKGLVPNVFTWNCVIKLLCVCGSDEMEMAYQLLDEMIEKGVKPDVWGYNAVLAGHCRLGEVNKAIRVLDRMDRDGCAPDRHTYAVLLKMLIRVGRMDRAMEVWDGMEARGFYPAAASYAVMVHGLCRKRSCIKDACRYFEAMVDEGIPPFLSTCELMRSQLFKYGLKEKVQVLTDKMRRSTSCVIQELSTVMDGSKRVNCGKEDVVHDSEALERDDRKKTYRRRRGTDFRK